MRARNGRHGPGRWPRRATFVEAFSEGPKKLEGMGWQSLRLVFVEEGVTTLHVVGIVHGQ